MYIGAAPRGDDRTLIAAFQAGDTRAGNQLFRNYRPSLIRQCESYRKQYPWLAWDDLFDAAQLAFVKALHQFDLSRSNGLNAYVRQKVRYALQEVLKDGLRRGMTGGDTDAGRWISGNPSRLALSPAEIAKGAKVSPGEAEEALLAERTMRLGMVSLSGNRSDDDPEDAERVVEVPLYHELSLRRQLDAAASERFRLGWERYKADLAAGRAVPGGVEPDGRARPKTRPLVFWSRDEDGRPQLEKVVTPTRPKGKHRRTNPKGWRRIPLTPDVIRAAHQSLAQMEGRQRQRRVLPGFGILPDPNGWRKPHPSRVVQRKRPRLRLVIDNAPMAQKGQKWNPQKKLYNAMGSSLRLESTPAWHEPWTPSPGGSC